MKTKKECKCHCHNKKTHSGVWEAAQYGCACFMKSCEHCHPSERGIEKLENHYPNSFESVVINKINELIDIINTLKP